jgi:hypothetical protein
MEARRELFNILMNGLPADEQRQVLQSIVDNDVRQRQHILEASAREEIRIQERSDKRELAYALATEEDEMLVD